jgi:serine/threonine-protein kinase
MENGRATGDVLSAEEIAYLLSEMLAALHHVHCALVAHLDVSLDNIVISLDGSPKLVDFGISTVTDGAPLETCAGKPPYMAPEVLQGHASPLSDQVGLGVAVSELAGGDVEAVPIEVPPALPAPLRRLVERLIRDDPAQRFASCDEAREQLHAGVGWAARWRGRRALRARVLRFAPPGARARALAAAVARARRNALRTIVVVLIVAAAILIAAV